MTKERADEIWRKACENTRTTFTHKVELLMTAEEIDEVYAKWATMGGWSSFTDAFLTFNNGR